jgi:anthranilate phosphoribosyltransferase
MLKRPFLATMEKVLNPCGASILITSVFHITYLEKMITLADMTGFTAVIVLKRGLEGTLAPSTARASGILCAARQQDGTWKTHSIAADTVAFSAFRSAADEVVAPLHAGDNLSLIRRFTEKGQTGNTDFDNRINLSIALYAKGMEWLNR